MPPMLPFAVCAFLTTGAAASSKKGTRATEYTILEEGPIHEAESWLMDLGRHIYSAGESVSAMSSFGQVFEADAKNQLLSRFLKKLPEAKQKKIYAAIAPAFWKTGYQYRGAELGKQLFGNMPEHLLDHKVFSNDKEDKFDAIAEHLRRLGYNLLEEGGSAQFQDENIAGRIAAAAAAADDSITQVLPLKQTVVGQQPQSTHSVMLPAELETDASRSWSYPVSAGVYELALGLFLPISFLPPGRAIQDLPSWGDVVAAVKVDAGSPPAEFLFQASGENDVSPLELAVALDGVGQNGFSLDSADAIPWHLAALQVLSHVEENIDTRIVQARALDGLARALREMGRGPQSSALHLIAARVFLKADLEGVGRTVTPSPCFCIADSVSNSGIGLFKAADSILGRFVERSDWKSSDVRAVHRALNVFNRLSAGSSLFLRIALNNELGMASSMANARKWIDFLGDENSLKFPTDELNSHRDIAAQGTRVADTMFGGWLLGSVKYYRRICSDLWGLSATALLGAEGRMMASESYASIAQIFWLEMLASARAYSTRGDKLGLAEVLEAVSVALGKNSATRGELSEGPEFGKFARVLVASASIRRFYHLQVDYGIIRALNHLQQACSSGGLDCNMHVEWRKKTESFDDFLANLQKSAKESLVHDRHLMHCSQPDICEAILTNSLSLSPAMVSDADFMIAVKQVFDFLLLPIAHEYWWDSLFPFLKKAVTPKVVEEFHRSGRFSYTDLHNVLQGNIVTKKLLEKPGTVGGATRQGNFDISALFDFLTDVGPFMSRTSTMWVLLLQKGPGFRADSIWDDAHDEGQGPGQGPKAHEGSNNNMFAVWAGLMVIYTIVCCVAYLAWTTSRARTARPEVARQLQLPTIGASRSSSAPVKASRATHLELGQSFEVEH